MKYRVYVTTIASCGVEVEADNPEEAEEKALGGNLPSVCAKCAGWGQQLGIELGGWEVADPDQDIEPIGGGR